MICQSNPTPHSSLVSVAVQNQPENQLPLEGMAVLEEDPDQRRRRKSREYSARSRAKNPERARQTSREGHARLRAKFPERYKKYWADSRLRQKEAVQSNWRIKTSAQAYQRNVMRLWRKGRQEELAGRPRPKACEVCSRTNKKIHWDHDHASGRFRGWICSACNIALGMVDDSPEILRKLIKYLESQNVQRP